MAVTAKSSETNTRRAWLTAVPVAFALAGFCLPSQANALGFISWSSVTVKSKNPSGCFNQARSLLNKDGFSKVEKHEFEVVGNYQGTYTTITCIATQPQATAVIMVISDNEGAASRVDDMLAGQLGQ